MPSLGVSSLNSGRRREIGGLFFWLASRPETALVNRAAPSPLPFRQGSGKHHAMTFDRAIFLECALVAVATGMRVCAPVAALA